MRVNRDDFMHALEEVRASFGVSEAELKSCVSNGIIKFDSTTDVLLNIYK